MDERELYHGMTEGFEPLSVWALSVKLILRNTQTVSLDPQGGILVLTM
jgi:hypothetical protein